MTAGAIIGLVGLFLTLIGIGVKLFIAARSRRAERAETGRNAAEHADDIRKRVQDAQVEHSEAVQLPDADLYADVERLRRVAKSRRKTSKGDL